MKILLVPEIKCGHFFHWSKIDIVPPPDYVSVAVGAGGAEGIGTGSSEVKSRLDTSLAKGSDAVALGVSSTTVTAVATGMPCSTSST